MANADKAISRRGSKGHGYGRFALRASSNRVSRREIAVAVVCLSCVFFLTSVQDVFNLPKVWLASLGVLVGLWGRRRC